MTIARGRGRDCKFCFLLNLSIDSFTQYWSTHYVACTRCHSVPQDRKTTIYIHTLLDEVEEGVCAGGHDSLMKNLLDIRLI